GLFSNVSMGEPARDKFWPLRIAPINRDLRDIVDFVDLFPFLNHKVQGTQSKDCLLGETMYVRRLTRRTYNLSFALPR
ncbi:MAG: hypothetical protein ACQEQO_06710, partial [Thermodesulfobacteriota bacterium]